MATRSRSNRSAFSVPDVWRRIQRLNEKQGSGKFDVLVCGHAVPASDTSYRRFRACPECRVEVQRFADERAQGDLAA
jgi:hypothetical protein